MRVLVVEDDRTMASLLEQVLLEEGVSVAVAANGVAGLEAALGGEFDAVVLDVMLPGLDGFGVVHRLREAGCRTPVLLLSARDAAEDVRRGMALGADDYLTKPFAIDAFLARLRALERREVWRDGRRLELGAGECRLLERLSATPGQVVTREEAAAAVWGAGAPVDAAVLDALAEGLRAKLEGGGGEPVIRQIRGVGLALRGTGE